MQDKRQINIDVFEDTMKQYKSNAVLKAAVSNSIANQKFTGANEAVDLPQSKGYSPTVTVSGKRSLEAAVEYAKLGMKTCVLNFASASNPGGGVTHGSSAQEEAICRCSTLYPCLNSGDMWGCFYTPHRAARNPLYNDDCIYTPDVYVIKSDTNVPKLLPESEWQKVNIITCAAPNLRPKPSNSMNPGAGDKQAKVTDEELAELLCSRVRRIFEIAAANGNEALILGAFGCGAFMNPPIVVAKVFAEQLKAFGSNFKAIEFAVFHTEREAQNYNAFKAVIK